MYPVSILLFVVACCLAAVSVIASVVLPYCSPYYRIYGATPDYRPALIVLAFSLAARFLGL